MMSDFRGEGGVKNDSKNWTSFMNDPYRNLFKLALMSKKNVFEFFPLPDEWQLWLVVIASSVGCWSISEAEIDIVDGKKKSYRLFFVRMILLSIKPSDDFRFCLTPWSLSWACHYARMSACHGNFDFQQLQFQPNYKTGLKFQLE